MRLMEGISTYLKQAVESDCSDLFVAAGKAVTAKRGGAIIVLDKQVLTPEQASELINELYGMAERPTDRYLSRCDDDFSVSVPGLARFRVSTYRQRGTAAAVIRAVRFGIPDYREKGIPEEVISLADLTSGLVLVTGPADGGKSTTLACITDAINHRRSAHIVTIEDPIEYLHRDDKSYITQRELAVDTQSYAEALRASLRQSSDVIVLGEFEDEETIRLTMSAAESGHLVISTVYTLGAVTRIDHIVDRFPPERRLAVQTRLSKVLKAVVSQQLLPKQGGGVVPAFEILLVEGAVQGMLRAGHTEQIDSVIRNFAMSGTVSMDDSILKLFRAGTISRETALQYAMAGEQLKKRL